MDARKIASNTLKVVLPLMLSGGILYWMYRGFDFDSIRDVLFNEMSWTWMLLSMPFGVLAQLFRAWRWRLALEPLGEQPRMRTTADSIFLSYALSLVVPRVGEVARCGVLRRYDGVSFAKAIGTVVTERMVDMVLMLLITALGFAVQLSVFGTFFSRTGTRLGDIAGRFTTAGWLVTAVCGVAAAVLLLLLLRRLSFYDKVRDSLLSVGKGILFARDLGQLFPSLLSHVLLLRLHRQPWHHLRARQLRSGHDSGDSSHTQRSRPVAFRSEDNADTLWRCRHTGTLLCAHRPYAADPARGAPWHLGSLFACIY